jgi:hypothetical protein
VDDVVTAGAEHALGFQAGPKGNFTPFVLVRDGLKARLTRPVYYELAALAVEHVGAEGLGIWSDGVFFPFPAADRGDG